MDPSAIVFFITVGITMQAMCLHAGFDPGSGPRTTRDLCPRGFYNSLALCPEEFECTHNDNCSSENICCPNSCGTSTCVAPWIQEEITEDQSLCNNVTCPGQGRECLVFNERTWCMCIRECERITHNRNLVCDQNGTTHLSRCHLDKRACEYRRHLIPTRCASLLDNFIDENEPISAPSFNFITADHSAEVGDTVRLICRPNGNPRPTILWQDPDGNIYDVDPNQYRPGDKILVASDGTLIVNNLVMSDKGKYRCIASSKVGLAVKTIFLTVQEPINNFRSGRSFPRVDCNTFPIRQADRCGLIRENKIKHMWVYNKSKNNCEKQHFRDCSAVTNKFDTKEQCRETCVKDICAMPAAKGPCKSGQFFTRFAYNPAAGACQAFAYGGCGGNSNNFADLFDCQRICGSGVHRGPIVPRTCARCITNIPQAVCASDFVIVANIKHFEPARLKKTGIVYLRVEVTQVLYERSNASNLRQKNLRNRSEAKMAIRINLDAECPCPRITDIHPAGHSVDFRHRRSGRASRISAIIAGNIVNEFPTLTSKGLVLRNSTISYGRTVSSLSHPTLCADLERLEG